MKLKLIGIFVCVLLVGTVYTATGTIIVNKNSLSPIGGITLYVGGTGEGNYTLIQDAINDSVDGDTVYVYNDSSPYFEFVNINKSITLLGEDRETTIIDGHGSRNDVIYISAGHVTISGFTIQNCSNARSGIFIFADNITIEGDATVLVPLMISALFERLDIVDSK